jgi:hypothetical protein
MEAIIRIIDDDEGVDVQRAGEASVTEGATIDELGAPEEGTAAVANPPVAFQPANAPDQLESGVARPPRRYQGSNRR